MLVIREVIEEYGIFEVAYTDGDSKFKFSPRKPSIWQTVVVSPDEVGRVRFHSLSEDTNLDDILCLSATRHLKKDNTFNYKEMSYTLTRNRRTITPKAKVTLHIHPRIKIRAFYKDEFVQEFPFTKPEIIA